MASEKELEAFLKEYPNGSDLEPPTIYTTGYKNGVDLQFCGWSITLLANGTYFFNDTTGG